MAETITDVRPFTRVKDVDVEMTVVKPPAIIGLGNLLILHEVDAGSSSASGTPAPSATGTDTGKADAGKTGKRIVAGTACKAHRNPAFQYLPHRKRNAKPLP